MTGFGRGSASGEGFEVSVELNSVNRRNLDTTFSLPKDWQVLERPVAEVLRAAFSRGRIHCAISVDTSAGEGGLTWDDREIESTLGRFDKLANRVGCAWPPSAETLLRLILALQANTSLPSSEEAEGVVLEALKGAVVQLSAMRGTEGTALRSDLEERLNILQSLVGSITGAAAGRVDQYRELLTNRLKSAGLELELGDERVLKEIAIFADRCDVTEELTRLASHLEQFGSTMASPDAQGVGRKLEFILQEINREFNTIGSKANNLEVSKHVIEAKNEIERIREQIQNVE